MDSQVARVACRATDNSAHHVFAIRVTGVDTLGRQESHRARVIRNRPETYVVLLIFAVEQLAPLLRDSALDSANDGLKQIDIVIAENLSGLGQLLVRAEVGFAGQGIARVVIMRKTTSATSLMVFMVGPTVAAS